MVTTMVTVSGKFISLQFSPDLSYTLIGAFVTTYLLEKTRVCYQVQTCRNRLLLLLLLLLLCSLWILEGCEGMMTPVCDCDMYSSLSTFFSLDLFLFFLRHR